MAMDFGKIQAAASANTAKDHFELDEGETLVLLIPYPRGWENGREGVPWVTHETVQDDDAFKLFKRPIMSTLQAYCDTPYAREAAKRAGKGSDVLNDDGEVVGFAHDSDVLSALVDAGKMAESDVAKAGRDQHGWAVCKIADRRRSTDRWSYAYQKPQVARFVRGNNSKPGPQRIIENLLATGHGPDMMGELSEALDLIAGGTPVESLGDVHARLVKLTRVGKSQRNTVYGGELANNSDGEFANYTIPPLMLAEIARAIEPGAYCDLHTYFAERSIPSIQEIENKVYGKGGSQDGDGDDERPGMKEV